jgi:hypothetical protein
MFFFVDKRKKIYYINHMVKLNGWLKWNEKKRQINES